MTHEELRGARATARKVGRGGSRNAGQRGKEYAAAGAGAAAAGAGGNAQQLGGMRGSRGGRECAAAGAGMHSHRHRNARQRGLGAKQQRCQLGEAAAGAGCRGSAAEAAASWVCSAVGCQLSPIRWTPPTPHKTPCCRLFLCVPHHRRCLTSVLSRCTAPPHLTVFHCCCCCIAQAGCACGAV